VDARLIVPAKLFTLVKVMKDEFVVEAETIRETGLASIE
jgi:hypothetical protein